nr:LysR substrate-binding domain-containing protein [Marinomonas sp. TW1]
MAPYKLISVGRASGNRILLDKSLARDQVNLNSFYEVQHLSTSLGLVEMGLGISIVPKLAMPLGSASVLTSRPLKGQQIDRSIGLVKRSSTSLSPAADLFINILLERWSVVAKETL